MREKTERVRAPYWKQIVFVLTAGWIVIWIYRTILTPIYPIISSFFGGASDASLGNISSFYFLGYVCMQIPSGILVDRLGKKKILIPGFLLLGIGTLVVALSQRISTVFIGSILAGVGCGTYYGAAYSLTTEHVPLNKKSLATAIVNSGTAVGSGLGLISSSFFVGEGILPWQSLLYITAILVLIMIVIFQKFIREELPASKKENAPVKKSRSSLKGLFKLPMISAYILYFSTLYAYYLIDTWLPNFLETERGFQGTAIGVTSSLVFFAAIPGALVFSRIADRIPNKKVTIIIFLEIAAAFVLFITVTTSNQSLLIFGIIAYGFLGKLAVEPIIISWLGQYAPRKSIATTYGVFNFFGMSASVLVPSITGMISDATGTKVYAFYLAIGILCAGTLLFYLINRFYEKSKKEFEEKHSS
ncbi:MAG: MFS transporter [Enterococcus casseliflavus]|jgi:Sugar phosphate permease|nr:MFS transporter [Enterococcus casseliflavus]